MLYPQLYIIIYTLAVVQTQTFGLEHRVTVNTDKKLLYAV